MRPFDETKLSEFQKEQFELMSEREKDFVHEGNSVKVIDSETEEVICSFNKNKIEIPTEVLERFVSAVLPDIIEHYQNKKDSFTE